jgi:Tol biopolymer transport system component
MKIPYLLIFAIFFGCKHRHSTGNSDQVSLDNHTQIESFDISPDDKSVLLLTNSNGNTGVLENNIDGQESKWILKPPTDEILSNPRYSPNGKKILFIKHKRTSISESIVCIANRDGTNVQPLTPGDELITDAVFSNNGSAVLYCSSKKYKKYNKSKTKVTTEAHGFNIYAINVDERKDTQLTNHDALGIDNITEINDKYILFHWTANKKSGIFSFEKDSPERILRIFPINGTQESNLLVNPGYAPDRFILFVANAELYAMDMSSQKAERIYVSKGHLIQMLRGFHTKSRVMLKQFDEQKLTALNTDGSEIELIDIEFPK